MWYPGCGALLYRFLIFAIFHDLNFSYFSTKTYVVGTQQNRLNEMLLFLKPTKHL